MQELTGSRVNPLSQKNCSHNSPVKENLPDARDAIRTHEPLQEWILSPSELAGLSYPREYGVTDVRFFDVPGPGPIDRTETILTL